MTKFDPIKHQRRSIRLSGYDYSQAGLYFVTIICQDRAHLFGAVEDGVMHLNEIGQIAFDEWLRTEEVRDNIALHEFIIMPNHLHGIIEILFPKKPYSPVGEFRSPSHTIGSLVRGYKIATIKKIKELLNTEEGKGEGESGGRGGGKSDSKGNSKGDCKGDCKGKLQFAHTAHTAHTAPTALIEKIKSLDYRIWHRNYHEHIIRDERAYKNIREYIIDNPLRWDEDNLKSDF